MLPEALEGLVFELDSEILVCRHPHVDPVEPGVRLPFQSSQPVHPADQTLESDWAVILELDDLLLAFLLVDVIVSGV